VIIYGSPRIDTVRLARALILYAKQLDSTIIYETISAENIISIRSRGRERNRKADVSISAIEDEFRRLGHNADETGKTNMLLLRDIDLMCPKDTGLYSEDIFNFTVTLYEQLEYDYKNLFIVATAGDINHIDNLILNTRRFDYTVGISHPDIDESKLIAKHYLTKINIKNDMDEVIDTVSQYGYRHNWTSLEYQKLQTRLFTLYLNNNKSPLTLEDILNEMQNIILSQQ